MPEFGSIGPPEQRWVKDEEYVTIHPYGMRTSRLLRLQKTLQVESDHLPALYSETVSILPLSSLAMVDVYRMAARRNRTPWE